MKELIFSHLTTRGMTVEQLTTKINQRTRYTILSPRTVRVYLNLLEQKGQARCSLRSGEGRWRKG